MIFAKRSSGWSISSNSCFSLMPMGMLPLIVSATLLRSGPLITRLMASALKLGFVLTYSPNTSSSCSRMDSARSGLTCSGSRSSASTMKKPGSWVVVTIRPRCKPSTSTLMLPSGSFRFWMIRAMVPTVKMSPACGSSVAGSFWVARKR